MLNIRDFMSEIKKRATPPIRALVHCRKGKTKEGKAGSTQKMRFTFEKK